MSGVFCDPPPPPPCRFDRCNRLTVNAVTDATTAMNGRDTGAGYYHDMVNVRVGVEYHGFYHWARHGHVGNASHVVSEEVGADTLPGRVREASVWVIVQGAAYTDDENHARKQYP